MRQLVESRGLAWSIRSAGLRAESRIAPSAVAALRRRGIEVAARPAVQLSEDLVANASLVLCMTAEQRRVLTAAMPAHAPKIHVWGAFVDQSAASRTDRDAGHDVADPAGGTDEVYEATAAIIESLAGATLNALTGCQSAASGEGCEGS